MPRINTLLRNMALGGALLAAFAVVTSGVVAVTYDVTAERIAANERAAVLRSLHAIVPATRHDNDLFNDTVEVTVRELGSPHPLTIYRARKDNQPVAAILTVMAPDGYGGPIKMLVGVDYGGDVAGVRVVGHRETPGLGDDIEVERSDWITRFAGKSLSNPTEKQWKVKRDGGIFDQFTGATITPRAVVKATRNALIYFRAHRDDIFAVTASAPAEENDNHE